MKKEANSAARANALTGAAIFNDPSALDRAASFEENGSPASARGSPLTFGKPIDMPLVIATRAKQSFYVADEESLSEILGHSDFDGYPFSIDDQIAFENGTTARIEYEPGHQFHVWSEIIPTTVREVLKTCRALGADLPPGATDDWSFEQLFGALVHMPEPRRQMFRGKWIRK